MLLTYAQKAHPTLPARPPTLVDSQPVNKGQHLAEWRAIWRKVAPLTTGRKVSWDRFARESFELVRAALIYQRNALEMYAETELHVPLRPSASGVVTPVLWPKSGEPLFPNLMSPADARLGGVFMASASFRLPVALLKAVELSASPFEDGEVRLLKREPDWNRNAISGLFDGLRKLRCCVGGPLGPCASQPRRAVWYGTKPVSRSSSSAARSSSNPGPTAPACGSSAPSSDG